MVAFGLTITVLLIALGFLKKRNKLLFYLQGFWLWLIVGFSDGGTDFVGNAYIYNQHGQRLFQGFNEWLSNIIIYFFHKFSFEYWEYNCIVSLIAIIALMALIYKVSLKPCAVMSMFYIYPLVDSVVQKRFFLSMCLVVFALYFLKNKKRKLYILFIVLASGFHITALIYFLVGIFINNEYIPLNVKKIIGVLVFLLEIYFLQINRSIFYITGLVSAGKIDSYLNTGMSVFASSMFISSQILYTVLTCLILSDKYCTDNRRYDYSYIKRINVIMLLLIPFLFINSTFSRIYRTVMVISYIYISEKLGGGIIRNTIDRYLAHLYVLVLIVVSVALFLKDIDIVKKVFIYNKALRFLVKIFLFDL